MSQSISDGKERTVRKLIMLTLFAAAVGAIFALPAAGHPRGTNGRIVVNADAANGQEQVYTLNPDGSDMRLLATSSPASRRPRGSATSTPSMRTGAI